MKLRWLAVCGLVVVLLVGCSEAMEDPGGVSSSTVPPAVEEPLDYGPFMGDGQAGVITGLAWLEPSHPALPEPLDGPPVAVLMDTSQPDVLHIAVNGALCKSEVFVSVVRALPDLGLRVTVGDYILEPGIQCPEALTTHGFEVHLAESVSLDRVEVNGFTRDDLVEAQVEEPTELGVIVLPDEQGRFADDLLVGCSGGPAFPASVLNETPLFDGTELPSVDAALQEFLADEEGQFWPQDGWQILYEAERFYMLAFLHEGRGAIEFVGLELEGDEWGLGFLGGRGSCDLEVVLPVGLNAVDWFIDPEGEPLTPESTSIEVLVTERACASGEPVGDRLVGPEIVMTDTEVLIAFAATAQSGAQYCPANPPQAVVVELPEPLGDRAAVDGLDLKMNLAEFLS